MTNDFSNSNKAVLISGGYGCIGLLFMLFSPFIGALIVSLAVVLFLFIQNFQG